MALTRALGTTAQFCVGAIGTGPLKYQWRLNGAVIAGETAPCLTRANLQVQDFGTYSVTLANEFGAVTSAGASLLLDILPTPGSDNIGGATQLPPNGGLARGDNLFASKDPGEPNHAGKPGGKSVWYRWFATASGVAKFTTKGSGFDTLLAIYTGGSIANLAEKARDDDRGGFFTSEVRFNADEGTTYYIAIDGFAGDEGTFLLQWGLDPQVPRLPVIIAQPASKTVKQGADVTFSVGSADQGLSYQWFLFDTALAGETGPTLTRMNVQRADVGSYTVRVMNNLGGTLLSDSVLLEIGPVLGIQSFDKFPDLAYSILSGTTAFISVRAGQITLSQVLNNTDAFTSAREPNHCGVSPSFTRWIGLTNEDSGTFEIDTVGSSIPTLLGVYYVTDLTVLHEVVCDHSDTTGRPCRVTFRTHPGTNYYIVVDGLEGGRGEICVNWKFNINVSAQRSGGNCLLSWFALADEYQLQASPALRSPPGAIVWSAVSSAASFDRGTNRVTVALPAGPTNRVFRLRKP